MLKMKSTAKLLSLLLIFSLFTASLFGCGMLPFLDDGTQITEQTDPRETSTAPEEDLTTDPYIGVSKSDFYASYTPAASYMDAYYRTQHFLMSGSIDEQDQDPTISQSRPMENGMLVRNTSAVYEDNGNTYIVFDANGDEAFRVYRGGGYVTLEEVAAYVYAFGDIPANYISKKSGKPETDPWGIYLRVNHSSFFGNTTKYPYEPELPNISGCGGELEYFEIDIGTTGTDCDPSYRPAPYNNGSKITRGAARIVYTRHDINNNKIIDPNERYVFYTHNHYNDFREYLNYEGGWGEMFGNITGGGQISSKTDYNPTPYIPVARRDLTLKNHTLSAFYADKTAIQALFLFHFSKQYI